MENIHFDLESELEKYQPWDSDETCNLQLTKDFIASSLNLFSRSNFAGHISVSYIVDVAVNDIQTNERKNEPAHKHYDIYFMFTTPEENYIISDESNDLKWFTLDEFKRLEPTLNRLVFIQKWVA